MWVITDTANTSETNRKKLIRCPHNNNYTKFERKKKMNYQKHYDRLIERAKTRNLPKETYTETHHVVPRCQGGSNDKSNLVRLLPEEHLIAHLLLAKINPTHLGLLYAANFLSNKTKNKRNTNKSYGWIKRNCNEAQKGVAIPDHVKEKQSITWKQKYENGHENNRIGTTITDEHKKIISEANKGKTVLTKSKSSLEGYIIRYGEELGTTKYKEDGAKKVNTLETMTMKYGAELGLEKYNKMNKLRTEAATGRIKSEESRKLLSETLTKKYQEEDHHVKGTFWITNGTENKRWSAGELPEGFKIGRVFDKPRKPTTPPLVIFDSTGSPVMTIINHYQKSIKALGLPSALYYTMLNSTSLFETITRPSDVKRLVNADTWKYKGWYARYMEA